MTMSSSCDRPLCDGERLRRVIVATGNPHKVDEIRAALPDSGLEFVAAAEAGVWIEPEETGDTFLQNARIKARAAFELFGCGALADDSGLEVDALDGAPGVRSARYAGEKASDANNNTKLLSALQGVAAEQRKARFRCVIVLIAEDGSEVVADGACEGSIGFSPRGDKGFGYDPLFLPADASGRTMAELSIAEKTAISHRGRALAALQEKITGQLR